MHIWGKGQAVWTSNFEEWHDAWYVLGSCRPHYKLCSAQNTRVPKHFVFLIRRKKPSLALLVKFLFIFLFT